MSATHLSMFSAYPAPSESATTTATPIGIAATDPSTLQSNPAAARKYEQSKGDMDVSNILLLPPLASFDEVARPVLPSLSDHRASYHPASSSAAGHAAHPNLCAGNTGHLRSEAWLARGSSAFQHSNESVECDSVAEAQRCQGRRTTSRSARLDSELLDETERLNIPGYDDDDAMEADDCDIEQDHDLDMNISDAGHSENTAYGADDECSIHGGSCLGMSRIEAAVRSGNESVRSNFLGLHCDCHGDDNEAYVICTEPIELLNASTVSTCSDVIAMAQLATDSQLLSVNQPNVPEPITALPVPTIPTRAVRSPAASTRPVPTCIDSL